MKSSFLLKFCEYDHWSPQQLDCRKLAPIKMALAISEFSRDCLMCRDSPLVIFSVVPDVTARAEDDRL